MWLLYLALGIALVYAGLVSLATLFQTKLDLHREKVENSV